MKAIFVTENSKTHRKKNIQFYQCRRENLPLVVIVPGRKYASVEIDMITTDRNLDDSTANEICTVLVQYSEPRAQVWRSHVACRVERVPISTAETVATRIYNIAYEAMPKLRHCNGLDQPWERRM
jgi:hypothetical protein